MLAQHWAMIESWGGYLVVTGMQLESDPAQTKC